MNDKAQQQEQFVSVVIPLYNEEENVERLVAELSKAVEQLSKAEVILVDDGSSDSTWRRIETAAERHAWLSGLKSPRNEGQSAAMLRGLRHASGDILVTMDGDLQNNPADIPGLIAKLGDFDCICGYRANRRDSWSRRKGSRLANKVRNWVTHDGIRDTGCSLKAFRKNCVDDLPPFDGVHRFMPAYFQIHGRTVTEAPVDHRAREFGDSKYTNMKRLPKTIMDLFGFWWYRSRFKDISEPSQPTT